MTSPNTRRPSDSFPTPLGVVVLRVLAWSQVGCCTLLALGAALLVAASTGMRDDPTSSWNLRGFFLAAGWTGLVAGATVGLALGVPLVGLRGAGAQVRLFALAAVETLLTVVLLGLAVVGYRAWGSTVAAGALVLAAGTASTVALALVPSSRRWAEAAGRAD